MNISARIVATNLKNSVALARLIKSLKVGNPNTVQANNI